MLEVHLNPDIDAASRSPETIDRSVKWLIENLGLKDWRLPFWIWDADPVYMHPASPAPVCKLLAWITLIVPLSTQQIMRVKNNLNITYRYQNYLELKDENKYDAALLIYGDFCPLNPNNAPHF